MEKVPGSNETIDNYAIQSPFPMPSDIEKKIMSDIKMYEMVQTSDGIISEAVEITFCPDAKEKLMRNLKEIGTLNYAVEFCSFLISTQKMLKESEVWRAWQNHPDYKRVYKKLLEILRDKNNSFEIVKIICREISAPKEERERLLNILQKPECKEGYAEYLNQVIETVETIVKLFAPSEFYIFAVRSKVEDHEKPIVALKECLIAEGRHKIEGTFTGMFLFGLKRFDASQEEKKEIVDMMVEALPNYLTFIKAFCFSFKYTMGISRLQIRSSLQFISELLAEYSAEQKNVRELLGSLDEVIKTVDEMLEGLLNDVIDTSGINERDCCVEFLDETLAEYYASGASYVPKEHTWWKRYKGNFF